MDWQQMKDRCSAARFVGIAVLPNHRLDFTRYSTNRDCGVADAVAADGHSVWGVIYELNDSDLARLDASEGFRPGRAINSYLRVSRDVLLDGQDSKQTAAEIYFAVPQREPPLPSQTYKNLILTGAKHWHLPQSYIDEVLEAIAVHA
jgi:hypothetical protein